jgi:hypothetical protein
MKEVRNILEEQDKIAVTLKMILSESKAKEDSETMQLAIDMFMRQQEQLRTKIKSMSNPNVTKSKPVAKPETVKKPEGSKSKLQEEYKVDGLLF